MNLFASGYLISFLTTVILGVFVFVRNTRSQINQVFFALSISVALSAFSQFEFVKAESLERAFFWYRTGILWPLVLSLLLHFSRMYTRPTKTKISLLAGLAIYTPTTLIILTLAIAPESLLAMPIKVGPYWAADTTSDVSAISIIVILISAAYTAFITYYCIRHFRGASTRAERRQRGIVLTGVFICLAASVLSYGVLRALEIHTPDIATFGFALGCLVIGYATWRFNLFSLDIASASEEIVRAMPSALILIGPDNSILRVNRAASSLLGTTAEALVGRGFLSFFSNSIGKSVEKAWQSSKEMRQFETVLTDGSGDQVPVSLIFSAVADESGERAGTVCVARDLRAQIAAAAEKSELQERLLQAEKMEAIGRLAGGVAHDFNNILGGIMGYADLIDSEYGGKDDELSEYISSILDSSKRAASLVENLLAFARKGQIKLEAVDVHNVIRRVSDLLLHTVDRRISVNIELTAMPSTVMADVSQLHNAVLNVAVNARDAMKEGGTITIRTEAMSLDLSGINSRNIELEPGDYVTIAISDTGLGMSRETQDRIFEPFFTTKDVGKGTGLGLSSVYGTVQACNGTITVESTEGSGSTLTMYFPCSGGVVAREGRLAESVMAGSAGILVIDDDENVRTVTVQGLERVGYTAFSFESGAEGLGFLKQRRKDIHMVILDLNMPGESGYQVFENMGESYPDLPVLIATGLAPNDSRTAELRKKAAGFLQKPYNIARLSQAVHSILQPDIN